MVGDVISDDWHNDSRSSQTGRFVVLVALLAAFSAIPIHATDERNDGSDLEIAEKNVSVESYCAEFVSVYSHRNEVVQDKDSVAVKRLPVVLKWLSNAFQPRDSRFVAGYRCSFATINEDGARESASVSIYLTETREFAEFTQWECLQIVPIRRIVNETDGSIGYGVIKYFESASISSECRE